MVCVALQELMSAGRIGDFRLKVAFRIAIQMQLLLLLLILFLVGHSSPPEPVSLPRSWRKWTCC